jgi:hypothetical protein
MKHHLSILHRGTERNVDDIPNKLLTTNIQTVSILNVSQEQYAIASLLGHCFSIMHDVYCITVNTIGPKH